MFLFIVIFILLILLLLISYFWTHFGILVLLAPTKPWVMKMLSYGTFGEDIRFEVMVFFIVVLVLLTLIQIYFLNSKFLNKFNIKKLLLISLFTSVVASLSYTFLSSDIFNYLFAGKMLTFFHLNPYTNAPIALRGKELWLSFVANTENIYHTIFGTQIKYAYGPVFLVYSLIPFIIFSPDRFLGVFYGLKLLNVLTFMICGLMLLRINNNDRKIFTYWFFNPFLILELLINSHNDLVMITLFIASMYFSLVNRNKIIQIITFISSVATKFVNAPLVFVLATKGRTRELLFKLAGLGILFYHAYDPKQVWYYSWIYMIIPFIKIKNRSLTILFILQCLLLITQYSRFILLGQWGSFDWMPNQLYLRWSLPILLIISEITVSNLKTKSIKVKK